MTVQAFLLDSAFAGSPTHATVMTKLAALDAAHYNFTPTQTTRQAAHDSNQIVVFADVTEAELTADADLANLRAVNYPNAHCRWRWTDLDEFRAFGFNTLGESVRSFEAVSGRPGIVNVSLDGSGAADGTTPYDAIAWADVPNWAAGTSYLRHGKLYSVRNLANNGISYKDVASGGAATDAGSTNLYNDANLTPATFIDVQDVEEGYMYPDKLGWTATTTLFGANTYVNAGLCQPQDSRTINNVSQMADVSGIDPFDTIKNIGDKHILAKVASTAGLSAEATFYTGRSSSDCAAAPYGAPDAVIQDDGGAYTDLTTEFGDATTGDVPMLPAIPAIGDRFGVGHAEVFSAVVATMGTYGAGDYVLTPKYWNGSTYATVPKYTWQGPGVSDGFKAAGSGAPRLVFNPPDDWTPETVNGQGPFCYIWFEYTSGTVSTVPVASIGAVENTMHVVHLTADAVPDKVLPGLGLGIADQVRQSTAPGQVQIINNTQVGCDSLVGSFSGSNELPTNYFIKGGRYIQGGTGYQGGAMDEWLIGAADRAGPWDTSDRPDASNESALAQLITDGADPADFTAAEVAKFLHVLYVTVFAHPTLTAGAPPTIWNMDGIVADYVGEDYKGVDRSANADKHIWAIRARDTQGTHRRVISRYGHAMMYDYASADTTNQSPISANSTNIGPFVLDDLAFIGPFGSHTDNAAGMFAMRFGGGPGSSALQDSGQGLRDITFGRIVCKDLVLSGAAAYDNNAVISWNWDQKPKFTAGGKITFIGCSRGICAGGGEFTPALYVVTYDSVNGYVDCTADSYDGTTFNAFTAAATTGDCIYFGFKRWPLGEVTPSIVTSGVGSGLSGVWERATGPDTWSSQNNVSDGTSAFTAATGGQTATFDRETDVVQTDKGGDLIYDVYWVRFRITAGGYSTAPQITSVTGADGGGYLVMDEAGRLEFIDMEGPWMGIRGSNVGYSTDGRTVIFDRFTGRLKPGELISTFEMFWLASSATGDAKYTLSQAKAGQFDKAFANTNVHEDNVGKIAANVSTTPNVDIEELP